MRPILDLAGRTALVTGAGQGVGRAIALMLAGHGASVIVNDLVGERATRVVEEIEAGGGHGWPLPCDLTDDQQVRTMMAKVSDLGGVDILVNNAGIPPQGVVTTRSSFVETTPASWDSMVRLNLSAVMHVTHGVLPVMIREGWGRIVTITSDAGRVGEMGMAAYAAAKAGAAGFARSLALEVGQFGITVNCVSLSAVVTERVSSEIPLGTLEKAAQRYPMKRLGRVEDVANAVVFLCSDASSWTTGQTLPVNGGFSFAM